MDSTLQQFISELREEQEDPFRIVFAIFSSFPYFRHLLEFRITKEIIVAISLARGFIRPSRLSMGFLG
jgi:hypothetical protein